MEWSVILVSNGQKKKKKILKNHYYVLILVTVLCQTLKAVIQVCPYVKIFQVANIVR